MSAPRHNPERSERRLTTLRALVAAYKRPLTRYFERNASVADDVPDLVQEVFLRLSRIDDPDRIESSDGFIFVTASNVLRDQLRRGRTRGVNESVPIDETDIAASDFSPDRVLESRQAAQRIQAALLELPERTRAVFVLRMLEGWRMADVAASLRISTRAAGTHLARALAHVADRLQDWRA